MRFISKSLLRNISFSGTDCIPSIHVNRGMDWKYDMGMDQTSWPQNAEEGSVWELAGWS